jgi:hypothetical protein
MSDFIPDREAVFKLYFAKKISLEELQRELEYLDSLEGSPHIFGYLMVALVLGLVAVFGLFTHFVPVLP